MNTFNILLSKAECCGRQHVCRRHRRCPRTIVGSPRHLQTPLRGNQRHGQPAGTTPWHLAFGAGGHCAEFPHTHTAPRRLRAHVRPSIWRVVSVWEGIVAIGTEWRTWDLGQVPSKSNYLTGRFYQVISVHFWSTQANMYQVKAVSSLMYIT